MCQAYEGERSYMVAREHFIDCQTLRIKARADKDRGVYENPRERDATSPYSPWRELYETYHQEWHHPTTGEILFASK